MVFSHNQLLRGFVVLLLPSVVSASPDAPSEAVPQELASAPSDASPEAVRRGLTDRINSGSSQIVLIPESVGSIEQSPTGNIDIERFVSVLNAVADNDQFAVEVSGELNSESGTVLLRDARGYSWSGLEQKDRAPETVVEDKTRQLMAALGADENEMTLHARFLTRDTFDKGAGAVIKSVQVAWKVFVKRNIGGIPVLDDKVVVSFDLNGNFRKLIGKWTPVAYSRSILGSTLTHDQVMNRAVAELQERSIAYDSPFPIDIGTFFDLRSDDESHWLQLRGFVSVYLRNGSGRIGAVERYDFDI